MGSSSISSSIVGVGALEAALGELLSWLAHQCHPGSEEEDAAVRSVLHTLLGAPEPAAGAPAPAGGAAAGGVGVGVGLGLAFAPASAAGSARAPVPNGPTAGGPGPGSAPSTGRPSGLGGLGGPSGPSGVGVVLAAGGLTVPTALARYAGEWRPLWSRTFQAPLRRVLSALFAEGEGAAGERDA